MSRDHLTERPLLVRRRRGRKPRGHYRERDGRTAPARGGSVVCYGKNNTVRKGSMLYQHQIAHKRTADRCKRMCAEAEGAKSPEDIAVSEVAARRQRMVDLFYAMDTDLNGMLDVGEFREAMIKADHELSGPVVGKVLDSMDVHGRLTLEEFLAIADVRRLIPSHQWLICMCCSMAMDRSFEGCLGQLLAPKALQRRSWPLQTWPSHRHLSYVHSVTKSCAAILQRKLMLTTCCAPKDHWLHRDGPLLWHEWMSAAAQAEEIYANTPLAKWLRHSYSNL